MANDQLVGLEVKGLRELVTGLDQLLPEHQDAAGDAISEYLMNVFKKYPSRKSVTREKAYGQTFFSDRQRRFFFAALADGRIVVPYKRTQAFANKWRKVGDGIDAMLLNDSPYGEHLMDDSIQSRHANLIGWKKIKDVVKDKEAQIDRRMTAAGKKAMKASGFKDG